MSEEKSTPDAQEPVVNPAAAGAETVAGSGVQADAAAGAEEADFAALEEKLTTVLSDNERLNREVSDLRDQYLRTRADFENTRKRLQRDKEDSIQQANRQLLTDLTTVIDDFERALKQGREAKDLETYQNGVEMIERQFVGMLERKWGLTRFSPAGEAFDPLKHEAIAMEAREGVEAQTVLEVYQSGFMLHDKVLRTAKVKVSAAGA